MKKEQLIDLFESSCLDEDSILESEACSLINDYIDCIAILNPMAEQYALSGFRCYMFIVAKKDKFFIGFNSIFCEITDEEYKKCNIEFTTFKNKARREELLKENKKDEEILNRIYNNNIEKQKRTVLIEKNG